ncbi:hypothetical protein PORCAN_627 [Porphyromonas crevioricanis JCM 13913]|nr:hypothetical protein PORCAN_627 [Porphyromonas crevioricanis JCM 13913]
MYITSLDVSGNPELENLICYENANLKTITMGDVFKYWCPIKLFESIKRYS